MLRNTFKSSKYIARNISSWRKHVLEKEKIKVNTENVNKIVNELKQLNTEIFYMSVLIVWSSFGIIYCIRNK
jgi:ABC-type bacteriocin/lantibiotic exporter with double-glycine peptidase domain